MQKEWKICVKNIGGYNKMAQTSLKQIKSNYKGVDAITGDGHTFFWARICSVVKNGFKTEREAWKIESDAKIEPVQEYASQVEPSDDLPF